MPEISPDERSL